MTNFYSISDRAKQGRYARYPQRALLLAAFFSLVFSGGQMLAAPLQSTPVTGRVTDDTGAALPGANIVERGTTNGTVSDADGRYLISVSSPDAVLVFSFV